MADEKDRNGEASAEDTPMDKKGCMIKVGGYGMSEQEKLADKENPKDTNL